MKLKLIEIERALINEGDDHNVPDIEEGLSFKKPLYTGMKYRNRVVDQSKTHEEEDYVL